MANKGWVVQQGLLNNNDVDVMLVNDLHEHIPGPNCFCNPQIEVVGGILVVIHNSFDHREFIEQIEEWLCP